jgi:hypothetical protein
MFGKRVKIFRLSGFEVKRDISWLILALLFTRSRERGLFPYQYQGLSDLTHWLMGIAGTIELFFSIIFREFEENGAIWHDIGAILHGNGVPELLRIEAPSGRLRRSQKTRLLRK